MILNKVRIYRLLFSQAFRKIDVFQADICNTAHLNCLTAGEGDTAGVQPAAVPSGGSQPPAEVEGPAEPAKTQGDKTQIGKPAGTGDEVSRRNKAHTL